MADKKLNNVSTLTSSTLTSSDYAYVEDVSASNEQKKVTISDLAKVVGGQVGVEYISQVLAAGASITVGNGAQGYGFYSVVSLSTGYSCFVQLRYRSVTLINEASGATKNLTFAVEGNSNFTITNNGSTSETIAIRRV